MPLHYDTVWPSISRNCKRDNIKDLPIAKHVRWSKCGPFKKNQLCTFFQFKKYKDLPASDLVRIERDRGAHHRHHRRCEEIESLKKKSKREHFRFHNVPAETLARHLTDRSKQPPNEAFISCESLVVPHRLQSWSLIDPEHVSIRHTTGGNEK